MTRSVARKRKATAKQKPAAKTATSKWFFWLGVALAVFGLALGLAFFRSNRTEPDSLGAQKGAPGAVTEAKKVEYEVVGSYPHDPQAFLQGLVWHAGGFYESTGQYGSSTLRRVEFPSGKVLQSKKLSANFFGEGLALIGNKLYQLTWQEKKAFVYDKDSFELLQEFSYPMEGWGLAYDGKHLILSDGSNSLTMLDPQSFKTVRRLPVTMDGKPVQSLNELEFIEGEIWANIWHQDLIVRIEPENGRVKSYLNLQGILGAEQQSGSEAVLNGIAYDAPTKRIFISGKLWPKLFELRLK